MKSKQSYILNRSITTMLIAVMLLFVVAVFGHMNAYAAGTGPRTFNGVTWEITDDGVLKIGKAGETQAGETQTLESDPTPDGQLDWMGSDTNHQGKEEEINNSIEHRRTYWPWHAYDNQITAVEIVGDIKISGTMEFMFANNPNSIASFTGLDRIDTTDVDNMQYIFGFSKYVLKDPADPDKGYTTGTYGNTLVEEIDISSWNPNKARSLNNLFNSCTGLKRVNVSNLVNESAEGVGGMFQKCSNLEQITGLGTWDVKNVNYMELMFYECGKLKDVNGIEQWNVEKVEHMRNMFGYCGVSGELDLSKWKTENLRRFDFAFNNAPNITKINLEGWETPAMERMQWAFAGCTSLTEVKGLENFDTSSVTQIQGLFAQSPLLETVAPLYFDLGKVISANNMLWDAPKVVEAINNFISGAAEKGYSEDTINALNAVKDKITSGKITGDNALAFKDTFTETSKQIKAEEAVKAAKDAIDTATQAEADAAKAKEDLEKAKAKNPQDPAEVAALEDDYEEATKKANEAVAAAEEAIAKAKESTEKAGNAELTGNVTILEGELEDIALENDAREKDDAADKAREKAEELAKTNPGSEEAVKAAEDATKAAEEALEAAKKTGDAAKTKEAEEQLKEAIDNEIEQKTAAGNKTADDAKTDTDKAKADADKVKEGTTQAELDAAKKALEDAKAALAELEKAKAAAEEALKKAQEAQKNLPADATEEQKKAAEDAVDNAQKALDKIDKQITETKTVINDITQVVDNIQSKINNPVDPVGTKFTAGKNQYEISQTPGATWDGAVTLITAKNAKNVSVPKTVTYNGKKYEVNRIGAKAFRAKKIRKVTVGANVDTIDKQAFKGSKVATVVLKTKDLTKKSVKGALKGSKVKTVQVKVGSKKINKKFVKKYKKIFTKKNAGKKVTVK